MWPTIAADCWDHNEVAAPLASSDEGRSGRSAGSNTSLAVKPFLFFSPKATAGKLLMAISFWPAVVGRVGEFQELEGKVNCHLVGSARLPLVRVRGAHLLLLAPRNQATTILFYCCVSVFILFKTCDARMKRRSGYATINLIEARPLAFMCAGSRHFGGASRSFTVETQERLANDLSPSQAVLF